MNKVNVVTTVTSENDGLQLFAFLEDGAYHYPSLAFYDIQGAYKTKDDSLVEIWDNSIFLIDDLYLRVVRYCKLGVDSEKFDPELRMLLSTTKCSLEDLKKVLITGLKLGFFDEVDCEFFK